MVMAISTTHNAMFYLSIDVSLLELSYEPMLPVQKGQKRVGKKTMQTM